MGRLALLSALLTGIIGIISCQSNRKYVHVSVKEERLMTQLPTILNDRDLEELFPNPYQATNDDEIQQRRRARVEGKKVRVIGQYAQVNVRQRQDIPPLYRGYVAVDLEDGAGIFLYPGWYPNAIRPPEEISRYENQRVVVVGTVVPETPPDPSHPNAAALIGPCFLSIDSIEMAR